MPASRMLIDARAAERLVGETIREIGILMFVFGPLDAIYQQSRSGTLPFALALLGLCFMAAGIIIEIGRHSEPT